ncbi:hypothetical protein MIND_00700600 [Mycena indigotica]|uniref:Uncharacterized protein n=1 Tax=Mycena indigotica TaxID=2126181 RepID=A0A8H6SL55_9AGAR|nr:uncharacterized protein MIND_00700600 [Mycena indigotica]KAF7301354.1 hypothetical protein MIND_00700600 [Mycena indigotica]
MEKYSAFRDPGTGVQPFLPLVPPSPSLLSNVSTPLSWVVGLLRIALLFVVLSLHLTLSAVGAILKPIPFLGSAFSHLFTAVTARTALAILALWVSVDNVTRKRGRGAKDIERWSPRAGDLIVSNWVSWVEVLWLGFRFNPIFVLPITAANPSPATARPAEAISHTPGRRTGTGSANIQSATRAATIRMPIIGFRQVSLLSMLSATGRTPFAQTTSYESLEDIRQRSRRPVVVFPECTTSNGRALLRFAEVFKQRVPVQGYNVFVMCVRYDPPTRFAATLAHCVPTSFNPIPHIWSIATSLVPQAVSIRLLAPSESPSSQLFVTSEFLSGPDDADPLAEVCGALIAQIGKMKRTGMGWEDKSLFLDFFHSKEKR